MADSKKIVFEPHGGCSRLIEVDVDNDIIRSIKFTKGCAGNTQGVAALCRGMNVRDVVERLRGIDCKGRGTSCPDQLAKALEQYLSHN